MFRHAYKDTPALPVEALTGWRPRAQRSGWLPRGLVVADWRPMKAMALWLGIYAVALRACFDSKLQNLSMPAFEV